MRVLKIKEVSAGCRTIMLYLLLSSIYYLYGAEVSLSNTGLSYGETPGNWKHIRYSCEIDVTRFPGEEVNVLLPEMTEIKAVLETGTPPMTASFIGRKNPTNQNGITMNLESLYIYNIPSEAAAGEVRMEGETAYLDDLTYNSLSSTYTEVKGRRRLVIPSNISNGSYQTLTRTGIDGSLETYGQYGVIRVKTVPTITVEDIDFGQVAFGGTGGTLTRSARINLSGGQAYNRVNLSLSSATGNLTRAGGSENIPVSYRLDNESVVLTSSGTGTANLEVSMNTGISVPDGNYSGDVTVTVSYQ